MSLDDHTPFYSAFATISGSRVGFFATQRGLAHRSIHGELRRAVQVITGYATQLGLATASILVRLDGLYGDAAPLLDVLSADLGIIASSRAYHEARIWKW